jgi:hypothetical protein
MVWMTEATFRLEPREHKLPLACAPFFGHRRNHTPFGHGTIPKRFGLAAGHGRSILCRTCDTKMCGGSTSVRVIVGTHPGGVSDVSRGVTTPGGVWTFPGLDFIAHFIAHFIDLRRAARRGKDVLPGQIEGVR